MLKDGLGLPAPLPPETRITGGGGAVLGARLAALAPHAEVVRHARIQNAVGYFRYGIRVLRAGDIPAATDR